MEAQLDVPETISQGEYSNSYLLGVTGGRAHYWHVPGDSVICRTSTDPTELEPVDHDEDTVEEFILAVENEHDEAWQFLTDLGRFLRSCAPFRGTRILTHRQAQVYALRKIVPVSRSATAELLGVSSNTLDGHYQNALKKVNNAVGIAAAVEDY